MSGKFDTVLKHLLWVRPDDWRPIFGIEPDVRVEAIDADLSHVA